MVYNFAIDYYIIFQCSCDPIQMTILFHICSIQNVASVDYLDFAKFEFVLISMKLLRKISISEIMPKYWVRKRQ